MTKKEEKGIQSIQTGDKIFRKITTDLYSKSAHLKSEVASEEEMIEDNAYLGSQLGLICEYYLKGLLIPNINITLPEDVKNIVGELTEEEEIMLILADTRIKNNPKFRNLTNKQWRAISLNSLKSMGHSLISLLGTNTFSENKTSHLNEYVRAKIIMGIESRSTGPIKWDGNITHLFESVEKVVEEQVANEDVSDAFARGRYGIFDGYEADIGYLADLAWSIRKAIPFQYKNAVEVKNNENSTKTMVGKFIFPDFDSDIVIFDNQVEEISRVISVKKAEPRCSGTGNDLPIVLIQKYGKRVPSVEEYTQPELYLSRWNEEDRWRMTGYAQINYSSNSSYFRLKYIQDGKEKQLAVVNGEPILLWTKEVNHDNRDDHDER